MFSTTVNKGRHESDCHCNETVQCILHLCLCLYLCLCFWGPSCQCVCVSVGLLKIYFKYIEIAFGLHGAILAQNSVLYASCKKSLLDTFGLRYKTDFILPWGSRQLVMKAFQMNSIWQYVLCIFMHCQWPLIGTQQTLQMSCGSTDSQRKTSILFSEHHNNFLMLCSVYQFL